MADVPMTPDDSLPLAVPETDDAVHVLDKLTHRQKLFAQYYAIYHNGAKSARLAGYSVPSYSGAAVEQIMAREYVRRAIAYYEALFESQGFYTPEKVVKQWSEMADIHIHDAFTDEWALKKQSEWPPALLHALTGFEVKQGKGSITVKPKFAKIEALAALAKHFGVDKAPEDAAPDAGTTINILMAQRTTAGDADTEKTEIGALTIKTKRSKG